MSADLDPANALARAPIPEAAGGASETHVAVGECWGGAYQVLARKAEGGAGQRYEALHLATGTGVELWVADPVAGGRREPVWAQLRQIDSPLLAKPLEVRTGLERVEVWAVAAAPTLRTWRAGRPAPTPDEVRALVRDLAAGLALLHAQGLGHFAVSPENIFVTPSATGPTFLLGGLHAAELWAGPELIPLPVDPLYAPPEAAGLEKHTPGTLLTVWDCWSLGRTVQEFILGQNVLALLPPDLAEQLSGTFREQAEALLFERDLGSLRAGAVDLMPALEKRADLLLRGLLTSAKEGRWGLAETQEWLAGETPREHYSAARHERYFRLDGRGMTVAQAALYLAGPAHHLRAVEQVFGAEHPGTLANFLAESEAHRPQLERLESSVKLVGLTALASFAEPLRQRVAAAVALHSLGGGDFRWQGQLLTAEVLRGMIEGAENLGALRHELLALAVPVVLTNLKAHDFATVQLLERVVKTAGQTEALIARHGWTRDRPKAVWLVALESELSLTEKHRALRERYANSTQAALNTVFQEPHPTLPLLVLIVWAGGAAEKYGFVTHEEVKRRRIAELERRGGLLASLLFWLRLERALRMVPLLFGARWVAVAGGLSLFAALAVHVPGPLGAGAGLLPLLVLGGLRFALNRWHAGQSRRWAPGGATWRWRDGTVRCRAEAKKLVDAHGLPLDERGVIVELESGDKERTKLLAPEKAPRQPRPARPFATWTAAAIVCLVLAGVLVGSLWRSVGHPPSLAAHRKSWNAALGRPPADADAPAQAKVSWTYRAPVEKPFTLPDAGGFTPTRAQVAAAKARLDDLVGAFKPETITSPVAVYLQLGDNRAALLVFDARRGELADKFGWFVEFVPMNRMWLQIGERRVIFLEK